MTNMRTFRLDKLVRDGIVEGHERAGGSCVSKFLEGVELEQALRDKVDEEVRELLDAEQRTIEEYGDVQQALWSLASLDGITTDEIVTQVDVRASDVGSFSMGVFVETVTVPETSWLADYYGSNSERFPEVTSE